MIQIKTRTVTTAEKNPQNLSSLKSDLCGVYKKVGKCPYCIILLLTK